MITNYKQRDIDEIINLYCPKKHVFSQKSESFMENSSTASESQNEQGNLMDLEFQQNKQLSEELLQPKSFARKQTGNLDRFIPSRRYSKLEIALSNAHDNEENILQCSDQEKDKNQVQFLNLYKQHVLNYKNNESQQENAHFNNNNIFKYKIDEQTQGKRCPLDALKNHYIYDINQDIENILQQNQINRISKVPYKVLDAPALQDDFYLNLLDWGNENVLAVGLSSCVYLWNGVTSKVTKLLDLGITDIVTSVNWSNNGQYLAVGTNSGSVQIWDQFKAKKVRVFQNHQSRVGTIAFNQSIMTTGGRDKIILNRDMRSATSQISKMQGHKQEVCGLKWSPDNQQLASGGNDNKLMIWNMHSHNAIIKFNQHQAAVKAIAWSPHQHCVLVSGGGTADKTIRTWNTLQAQQLSSIETGSQVCNLIFSKKVNELVSTHGYSQNQIVCWKFPKMEKIISLTGHTQRVLYLSISPDGQTIVTGAGDETLRFWKMFPNSEKIDQMSENSQLLHSNNLIR